MKQVYLSIGYTTTGKNIIGLRRQALSNLYPANAGIRNHLIEVHPIWWSVSSKSVSELVTRLMDWNEVPGSTRIGTKIWNEAVRDMRLAADLIKAQQDEIASLNPEHQKDCECGGFERTASHSKGEYVGYCTVQ